MTHLTTLLLSACLLVPGHLAGQSNRSLNKVTRYGVWLTPTGRNNVTIDGIAIGPISQPVSDGQLRINGLNIEVIPVTVLMIPGAMIFTMLNVADPEYYAENSPRASTNIHGFSIGGGLLEPVTMNGLSWNFNSYTGNSHGIEMSFVMNSNYIFSGAQLSIWGNRAVEGQGLQFGCFNSCQEGSVFQIGLLNRIGNRVLPLINFSIKRKSRKPAK